MDKDAILRWYLAIKEAQSFAGHCTFCRRPLLGFDQSMHAFCQMLVKMDLGVRL